MADPIDLKNGQFLPEGFTIETPDNSGVANTPLTTSKDTLMLPPGFTIEETPDIVTPETDNRSMLGELGKGLAAGTEGIANLAINAVPAHVLDLLGQQAQSEKQFEDFQKRSEKISKKYGELITEDSFTSPREFALFTARAFGQGVPSLVATAGTGVATLLATKDPNKAAAATLAVGGMLNTSESYANLLENEVEDADKWAVGVGALKTGLDAVPIFSAFKRNFGETGANLLAKQMLEKGGFKAAAKKIGQEVLITGAQEGVTEAMQQAIDQAAVDVLSKAPDTFFTKDSLRNIAVAGYAGMLTGGLAGGITGAVTLGDVPVKSTESLEREDRAELLMEEVDALPSLSEEQQIIKTPEKAEETLNDLNVDPSRFSDDAKIKAANILLEKGVDPIVSNPVNLQEEFKNTTGLSPIDLNNTKAKSIKTNLDVDALGKTLVKPKNARLQRIRSSQEMGLYSKLRKTVEQKMSPKISSKNLQGALSSWANQGFYKQEELDYSGLPEFLDGRENVSKDEVLSFLESGGVKVQEIQPEGQYDFVTLERDNTKNYREFVFNMDQRNVPQDQKIPAWEGAHWEDIRGQIASLRTSDKDVEGVPSLFIEEIQSDLHQMGAKEGYQKPRKGRTTFEFGDHLGAPNMPFKKSWSQLALKRALRIAAEEGKTQVVIPKGDLVSRIQDHGDKRAAPFYEQRLVNEVKALGKQYGFNVRDGGLNTRRVDPVGHLSESFIDDLEFIAKEANLNERSLLRDIIDGWGPGLVDARKFAPSLVAQMQKELETITERVPVTIIELNPQATQKILGQGFPLYQRFNPGGYQDALHSPEFRDSYLWKDLTDNLKGLSFKPKEVTPRLSEMFTTVENAIEEVAGKAVKVNFMKYLKEFSENPLGDPVRGAQVANQLYLAVNLAANNESRLLETAYHEAWHSLFDENLGLYTDQERILLKQSLPEVSKYLEETHGVLAADIQALYPAEEGMSEILATAFGHYAVAHKQARKGAGPNLAMKVRGYFDRALRLLKRLGNALQGLGFNTFEDIFERTLEGQYAPQEIAQQNPILMGRARLEHLSEKLWDNTKREMEETPMRDMVRNAVAAHKTGAYKMGPYARSAFATMTHKASVNPIYGAMMAIRQAWEGRTSQLLVEFGDVGRAYYDMRDPVVQNRAGEILAHLRLTDQKFTKEPDGSLSYIRDNQRVSIKHPEMIKVLESLDGMMKKTLDPFEDSLRKHLSKFLPEAKDKSYKTLERRVAALEENKGNYTDEQIEEMKNIIGVLKDIYNLRAKSYIPFSRFGPYAIVVHHKDSYGPNGGLKPDATPAYYAHIEEGKHLGKYNELQYNEVQEGLAKFKNNPDFIVSDIFETSFDTLYNQLQDSMFTVETLATLLGTSKDEEQYANIMNGIIDKVKTKRFGRRFAESRKIEGYSKDWIRVIDSYVSSTAHYVARQEYSPELMYLNNQVQTKLGSTKNNQRFKEIFADDVNYMVSPQNEWQKFSTFNYMWTLGFNASSALLQVSGLPIFVLGDMSAYNPNVFENAGRISKNFAKLGTYLFNKETIESLAGAVIIRFDNKELINTLKLSPNASKFMTDFMKTPQSGDRFVEENLRGRTFESRTPTGKALNFWEVTKNFASAPMSTMEQLTRATIALSYYEMFEANPQAVAAAERALKDDQKFIQARAISNKPLIDDLVAYSIDATQGVFGKTGRGRIYRGAGRIFLPFMQYTMSMNELLLRQVQRGPEGKRAFVVTSAALILFAGLLGLPGAELLKELYEALYKQATGNDVDIEKEFRIFMAEKTGGPLIGTWITQGGFRATTPLDISSRIRQQIAGQELLLTALGIKGSASDIFGIQGSVASGVIQAVQSAKEGASPLQVSEKLLPSAAANIIKSFNYMDSGVSTKSGVQLVTPEEVREDKSIAFLRAIGFNHSMIASRREEQYWAQLEDKKITPKMNTFRSEGKRYLTAAARARRDGDHEKADEYIEKYRELTKEVSAFLAKGKHPYDMRAFHRSVYDAVEQRARPKGGKQVSDYGKLGRARADIIKEASGAE